MSDKWARTIRGMIQVGIVQMLLQGYQAFSPAPLTNEQYAVLTTLGTTLLTLTQNWLEDTGAVPRLMR